MTLTKIAALPLFSLSLALSTGCSAKPSPDKQSQVKTSQVQSHVKSGHNHSQASKTSAPQRYMKPGAAISYSHNLPKDIAPGQTVVFQLTLDESYPSGAMNVEITSEGDIQIFPTSSRAQFDMSAGREHVMDVSVTVNSNGRHYINVGAMADTGNGQAMPRIFSIPVQSGPVKSMQPNSKMMTTPTGENIIVMEAQETISVDDGSGKYQQIK